MRALGLRHALSTKAKASELIIVDHTNVASTKTKAVLAQFEKMGLHNALIIDEAHERSLNIDFLLGYLKQLTRERPGEKWKHFQQVNADWYKK